MTAEELREARKATGLSMKRAAEKAKTPYRTWQDWEGGKRRVPGIVSAWLELYREAGKNEVDKG
jgi:DNA-binding transcriptional regulator YiaG